MIAAAFRAASQVFEQPFRAIFWKSLGFTLAALFLIWLLLNGVVSSFLTLPYAWLDTALSILTGIGAFIGLGFLVAPVTALFAAFFQDDVAAIVEAEDYPAEGIGRAMPIAQSIAITLKFTGVVILGNILALLLLLIPGINLVAFFLVNGYLLGREFFEFAAMRFHSPAEARALRKAKAGTVFLAGLVIAGVLAVPFLNLLTPIFATIFMVHLYKGARRTSAAPSSNLT
ncbi:sulfate transporter family protein [Stappia sp. F7233]|uniref:Sulfate transporter family protein n=1 Tax=Stappia albiluteola TaxID=2758565 RepID=A0A839AEC3_9HYPH|nr:sulfate transporter family protein [Stappia albiluteola]MBA5776939.1 sulfate transporter family protein [Stappia albiluteola]